MMRIALWVALSIVCAGTASAVQNGTYFSELEGRWYLVACESRGKALPAEFVKGLGWVVTVKGNAMLTDNFWSGGKDTSTIELDPAQVPKWIDISFGGKTSAGIYKVENGRLTICLHVPMAQAKGRPKNFKTEGDDSLSMLTFERVKK